MAELKINEITFSNVDTSNPVLGAGAKHTRADLTDNGKYSVEQYDTIVNEVIKPGYGKWADFAMVNAVDIDWNGAQLKDGSTVKATLNTTGEMLSILQTA